VALPHPDGPLLERLGFAGDDSAELLAARPRGARAALVRERARELAADMGGYGWFEPWPFDEAAPWLHAWTFLATLADVRAYHRERGIADGVAWATLADLGRNAAIDRSLHGSGGLRIAFWLALHFRGAIYQLGRLQFNRGGDHLGVHVPETGPLAPDACDASFRAAAAFFPRHFPEEPVGYAECTSWLLDPALADYLPPGSNIVRFQRRFELTGAGEEADDDVFRFVFRRLAPELDELPQRTTLERAVVAHLRAGAHWRAPTGRVPLPPDR
jgi:hypothetical protein